ncbi:hypothetical protein CC86DRAFT_178373 [Ophiobolus disseminans]|uniref:Uncharacterized protein n=1 Tax=Ophiobolus disseminans TaxID=1469910 RepID=A0A6A7A9L4_9PLEO|nr:hypothetical protein CC86DRAFT_178373 [Ophiobolus disseminans]
MIYENLVDISLPRIVPEAEGSAEDGLNQHIGPAAAFGPFRNEPVFDSYVMGSQISIEIREFFIKRAPLYFRGWHNTQHINVLLDAVVSPEKLVRDLTQNMRMYLRCETFDNDISSYVDRSPLMCATHEEQQSHGEHLLYDTYRKRVRALEKLAFGNRKIKLEICIFQSLYEVPALVGFPTKSKDMRRLYNILEAIKPTYFCVKDQGAQVTVRCENFYSGEGLDMTWVLDADAEAWKTRARIRTKQTR